MLFKYTFIQSWLQFHTRNWYRKFLEFSNITIHNALSIPLFIWAGKCFLQIFICICFSVSCGNTKKEIINNLQVGRLHVVFHLIQFNNNLFMIFCSLVYSSVSDNHSKREQHAHCLMKLCERLYRSANSGKRIFVAIKYG